MIRIYHARILTMQEDQEIFDGEIWISDHKIQYVGPENKEEATKITWERQIDAKGDVYKRQVEEGRGSYPWGCIK